MPQALLKPIETARRIGVGRSTLFAMVAAGRFPPPRRLTARNVGFVEAEVDRWIEALPVASGDITPTEPKEA